MWASACAVCNAPAPLCRAPLAQVKVAVVVKHVANHRTEMVYKIVSPPIHAMPDLSDGVSYFEDATEGNSDLDAQGDAEATVDADGSGSGSGSKKRKPHKATKAGRPVKKAKFWKHRPCLIMYIRD